MSIAERTLKIITSEDVTFNETQYLYHGDSSNDWYALTDGERTKNYGAWGGELNSRPSYISVPGRNGEFPISVSAQHHQSNMQSPENGDIQNYSKTPSYKCV